MSLLSCRLARAAGFFSSVFEAAERGQKDEHQWSCAHPNDKLYFWLTVGMALVSSSSPDVAKVPCKGSHSVHGKKETAKKELDWRRGEDSGEIWCQSHEISRSFCPYPQPFRAAMCWIQIANFLLLLRKSPFLESAAAFLEPASNKSWMGSTQAKI